jgi:hypothetical protein
MLSARTLSVSIARPSAEVYAYLAQPARFPEWSKFITAMRPDGDTWLATTTAGEVRIRFVPRNAFGLVDHTVTVTPGVEVFVPLRVIPNQAGSEVLFTVFRQPAQDDAQYDQDLALVATDLAHLKQVLEKN